MDNREESGTEDGPGAKYEAARGLRLQILPPDIDAFRRSQREIQQRAIDFFRQRGR